MSRIQLIACDAVADQDRRVKFELIRTAALAHSQVPGFYRLRDVNVSQLRRFFLSEILARRNAMKR
jgi:hypothetical protein